MQTSLTLQLAQSAPSMHHTFVICISIAVTATFATLLLFIRRFTSAGYAPAPIPKPFLGVLAFTILMGLLILAIPVSTTPPQQPNQPTWGFPPQVAEQLEYVGIALMLAGVAYLLFDCVRAWIKTMKAISPHANAALEERKQRFWPLNRFAPELDRFKTDDDAYMAIRRSVKRAHGQTVLFTLFFLIFLAEAIGMMFRGPLNPAGSPWLTLAFPIVAWLNIVYLWFRRETIRRSIRKDLCKSGIPTCVYCGYNLHEHAEPRCPECGARFTVKQSPSTIIFDEPE